MPDTLTRTERRIFDYLVDYLRTHTYQPSIREIGREFDIKSTKTVSEHLQSLADKGYIERDASRSRAVRIRGLDLQASPIQVPLYGKVAAGPTALADEHRAGTFALDPELAGTAASFFLEVRGDSMRDACILEGDMVLVEPVRESEVSDGDIVAARVRGEPVVKRYFRQEGEVVLQPANGDYPPMLVRDCEDFVLLGRVGGLFRRMPPASSAASNGRRSAA
jgi:repressor LexA